MAQIKISDLHLVGQESEIITISEKQSHFVTGGAGSDVIIVYDDRVVIVPDDQPNTVVDRTSK